MYMHMSHITGGNDLSGVNSILNELSLHVITRFVEQYQRYHEDVSYLSSALNGSESEVENKSEMANGGNHGMDGHSLGHGTKDNSSKGMNGTMSVTYNAQHRTDLNNSGAVSASAPASASASSFDKALSPVIEVNVGHSLKKEAHNASKLGSSNDWRNANLHTPHSQKPNDTVHPSHDDHAMATQNKRRLSKDAETAKDHRPKHHKKLSMADRILAQYSSLTTLELSDDQTMDDGHDTLSNGQSFETANGKTGPHKQPEEPLVTHWRRQSLLDENKELWNEDSNEEDGNEDNNNSDEEQKAFQQTIEEKKRNEAMKCRFRARMICSNVLEHLHDKYLRDISLHYDRFYGDYSLHLSMKLKTLQQLIIEPFIFEIRQQIDLLLQETTEIDVNEVNTCIVTGDCATIPSVLDCIQEYFDVNNEFKNDPVVSYGCALVCATDQGISKNTYTDAYLDKETMSLSHLAENKVNCFFKKKQKKTELTSQPLSFEKLPMTIKLLDPLTENKLQVVLAKHTSCPCKKIQLMTTWMDDQTEIRLKFYEGEGTKALQCNFIGEYRIRGITPRKAGVPRITLILNIDRNCLFVVSAEDTTDPSSPIPLVIARGT
ncbi:hypothetical protein RFI_14509 [Reticulomyxa filosa]|uniref:Heat shock protein 70 n=1 Tax=Reticulomyxa filosa TaxID=46433 RepID=X6NA88_RETFI|nr:hypothetical protein RFI_14509 [Reticulomyxa filosa]|eukprot:ETO22684.1 hypothetical protein RFI_14509 [Reticulomyxa filosa]